MIASVFDILPEVAGKETRSYLVQTASSQMQGCHGMSDGRWPRGSDLGGGRQGGSTTGSVRRVHVTQCA